MVRDTLFLLLLREVSKVHGNGLNHIPDPESISHAHQGAKLGSADIQRSDAALSRHQEAAITLLIVT